MRSGCSLHLRRVSLKTSQKLALLALLILVSACNRGEIARLEKENRELTAKLNDALKAASLDLQAKCANQARSVFKEMGWVKLPRADYTNHYQQGLNKCFIQITTVEGPDASLMTHRMVRDAFEGRDYADCMWVDKSGKNSWEEKPLACTVTLLSGVEKWCHSTEEFNELIKVYMEQ